MTGAGASASRKDEFQLRMTLSDLKPPELRGMFEFGHRGAGRCLSRWRSREQKADAAVI